MLFRAILSLLSVPEGFGFGQVSQNPSQEKTGISPYPRKDQHDNLGKNRWGSFRGHRHDGQAQPASRMAERPIALGAESFGTIFVLVVSTPVISFAFAHVADGAAAGGVVAVSLVVVVGGRC